MTADITAVRNAIRDAIISAWPGVVVLLGENSAERAVDVAMVTLSGDQSIANHTPGTDILTMSWDIAGRFALASGANAEMEAVGRASSLRTALLASKNPGGVGFNPLVSSFSVTSQDPQDGWYDVLLAYQVSLVVAR